MSLLLIGGKSSLAKSLKELLNKKKISFTETQKERNSKLYLDLSDINSFDNIPASTKKAILFAGITNIKNCEKNKSLAYKINYENSKILINKLNNLGVSCLFISSSSVFSNKTFKNGETDIKDPDTYYGILKAKLEDKIIDQNLNTILRLTKVIMPDMALLSNWIKDLKNNKQISAYKDLYLSPISNISFNAMIYKWISLGFSGVLHLSSDQQISYFEFIKFIANNLGLNISLINPENSTKNIKFNPIKSYLECNSENSKLLLLEEELKIISKYYE